MHLLSGGLLAPVGPEPLTRGKSGSRTGRNGALLVRPSRNDLAVSGLSTDIQIQVVVAVIAGVALIVSVSSAWIAVVNERKRTQPILIAHEHERRHFSQNVLVQAWVVDSYLTNEGGGPAFNVAFGVEFSGVRFPYKLTAKDPDAGNVQRVVRPSERRPAEGSWPILVDSTTLLSGEADPDPGRIYWARYENAQGRVWESRNPPDRSAKLDIRRVRFLRWVEWHEQRKRLKAGKRGAEAEERALAELQAGMGGGDATG